MKVEIIKGNYRKNYKSQKLKVAAYVRVSTELEKQISSFESQRKYFLSKIHRNANWEFVGIYDDYGKSARSVKNRIGFNNMISDALNGKIDLILTKSISRFARNTVDSIEYVRLLKEHNVGIIFEEEGIYTLNMQSELLLTVLSSVSEQELDNLSSRAKKGIEMGITNGRIRRQSVVYGYTYKNDKMIINKKEAKIVKRIFNLYINGTTVLDICKILNNEKIKTPFNYKKIWLDNYVYIILRCEKYIGKLKFGKEYYYDYLRIISDDDFYKARKMMLENKSVLKKNIDYFSGIVRCGSCGLMQGFCSSTNVYSTAICLRKGCKNSINIHKQNVDRILLEFQNVLLESYEEIFKYRNEENVSQKRRNRRNEKQYYNKALFNLDESLNNKINKYEFINRLNKLNTDYNEFKSNINTEHIEKNQLNIALTNLKDRLLSIDSFPAEEVSKELVDKLVKYMQFGEKLKNNYKSKFNCRIVLKADESYSKYKARMTTDYSRLCDSESYIVLWKFNSIYYYMHQKKHIKVKIVIDKKDIEV